VSDFIGNSSVGNAVLVFGDTNSRYTRSADVGLRSLVSQNGLSDAWVQRAHGGVVPTAGAPDIVCSDPIPLNTTCEVVDKMLYRGSKVISLSATDFFYDTTRFLQPNGSLVTDHNPIRVDFSWSLSSALRTSDFYGDPHGSVPLSAYTIVTMAESSL
jgi:hypothetical protein